uniref:NADH dehydrogenase [ubiquinone] iron-sulfur protein 4, mitochondrial n=1 Tax=Meloidogyne incognita TaxID=6306 RepID=A0A914MEZ3_MELIC
MFAFSSIAKRCAKPLIFSTRTLIEIGPPDAAPLNSPIEGQGKYMKRPAVIPAVESSGKETVDVLGERHKLPEVIPLEVDSNKEVMDIGGVPEEHREGRRAVIYKPARNAMQSGWNNVTAWKIELDNRERWEDQTIGWCSSGDPLSNINMALSFASKDDAINFCEKNRWAYEIREPEERKIVPKAYGSNFHWNKRTRVSTK